MKRAPPEDFDEEPPLFRSVEAARDRGHRAAQAASSRASSLDAGWKAGALEAVRVHATRHERFLVEHLRRSLVIPEGADARALGHIVKEAERLGWIRADGFAPAASSNGSAKVAWKSLIYTGVHG